MKGMNLPAGGLIGAVLLVSLLLGATLAGSKAPSNGAPEVAPDIQYTLRSARVGGRLVFVGVGGEIGGIVNPTLHAEKGQVVRLTLENADEGAHELALPDFAAKSAAPAESGRSSTLSSSTLSSSTLSSSTLSSSTVVLRADHGGSFPYYCTGHRAEGMVGRFVVD